jgi:hypothetical protein
MYESQADAPFIWSCISNESVVPSKEPQAGYMFRNLANENVYFSEQDRRMIVNYRNAFLRLAVYYNAVNDKEKIFNVLEIMEKRIPRHIFPIMWQLQSDIASLYYRSGHIDRFNEYSNEIENIAWEMIRTGQGNASQYYNPWRILLEMYQLKNDQKGQLNVLNTLTPLYPNDEGLKKRIKELDAQLNSGAPKVSKPDSAK